MTQTQYSNDLVSLWYQQRCGDAWKFLGCHDMSGLTEPEGEITARYIRAGKGKFKRVGYRRSIADFGSATIRIFRSSYDLVADTTCPPNIFALYSNCGADNDPSNYDFMDIFETVIRTEKSQENVSKGIGPDGETDTADIVVEISIQFLEKFVHKALTSTVIDVSNIRSHNVNDVAICDKEASCGGCSDYTLGCQTIWLVTNGVAGSIGTPAAIRKSTDRGTTWTNITNPFSDTDDSITKVECSGDTVIIINGETSSYAYSSDGSTFTEVLTPTQIIADVAMIGPTNIWLAAAGGYIYYSANQGQSVSTQTAGDITTQNLAGISFADSLIGYAVGASNTMLRTTNGGGSNGWAAITGPSVGNNLTVVKAVPDTEIVFVGDDVGNVFRSDDKGATWTTSFTANTDTAGGITSIAACNCNVLMFAANVSTDDDGNLYKTVNGGASWTSQTVDTNTGLLGLKCCNLNEYWTVGNSGFIARVAGPSFLDA